MSVRLLFDQNLSPKLVDRLADVYLSSAHVDVVGLGSAEDSAVWQYAKENGFAIVTKDADFADLAVFRGFPPQVVWIRRGNCSTNDIEELLRESAKEIESAIVESTSGILTLF